MTPDSQTLQPSNPPTPLVSVCMPVFNGEKYLREAIDSILNQTFRDFELLIIDDGSTDRSVEIIHSYCSEKIRLLQNGQNRGLVFTRNRLFDEARGRYIALLDCDDRAHPERLSAQFRFMEANPDCALLGTWAAYMHEDGTVFHVTRPPVSHIGAWMLFRNCFVQSSVMLRTPVRFRYREAFPPAEDYDLWAHIVLTARVANLPEVYTYYRVHPGGITKKDTAAHQLLIEKIIIEQLAELGLFPSPEEVKIHRSLAHQDLQQDREFVTAAHQWLCKLHRQASYRPGVNEVLGELWFKVCSFNHRLGWRVLADFLQSPLCRYVPIRQRLALAALCAVYTRPFAWVLRPMYAWWKSAD